MTSAPHRKLPADDAARGAAMFFTLVAAVLGVTGVIGLLGFFPTWWMLAIALAAHAVGTVIVFALVMIVITDRAADDDADEVPLSWRRRSMLRLTRRRSFARWSRRAAA
jgi:hypothetical protein